MADDQKSPDQGTLLVHWRQLASSWPELLRLLAAGNFRLSAEFPSFVHLPDAAVAQDRALAPGDEAKTDPLTSGDPSHSEISAPGALGPSAPPLRRLPRPRRLAAPAAWLRRRSG